MNTPEEPTFVTQTGELSQTSSSDQERDRRLREIATSMIQEENFSWSAHSHLTLKRQALSRILYYDTLYKQMLGTPGVILEFGVQWGATLALLTNLRGIYEPFNHSRRIVGFDTFEGFPHIDGKDGRHVQEGGYAVPPDYEDALTEILQLQESLSPVSHLRKFELVKGDASQTIDVWLDANPHAIVAMAIFDMDIYLPTRDVLSRILPRLTKGSLLVFDELNHSLFPGETVAVREVLDLNSIRLQHYPHQPNCAWAVVGD